MLRMHDLGADAPAHDPVPLALAVCELCRAATTRRDLTEHRRLKMEVCATCAGTADRLIASYTEAELRQRDGFLRQLPTSVLDVRAGAPEPVWYRED